MKSIKILAFALLTLVAASKASAQNDLILMLTLDGNDYDWYSYDLTRPKNQQVSVIKVTEYDPEDRYQSKVETLYHYDFNNLLTSTGRITYSESDLFKDFPYVSGDFYDYSLDNDKQLTSCYAHGDFKRYFYDNLGRITKTVNYYTHDNTESEGETLIITYADKSSDIIKSMSYNCPLDDEENWKADFKYNGNVLTISVKGDEFSQTFELKKVNNKWIKSRIVSEDEVDTFNEEGLRISTKSEDSEYFYIYNQNGDLIRVVRSDSEGRKVTAEFEYQYDSRLNWIKKWDINEGKRTLVAEREYLYRVQ